MLASTERWTRLKDLFQAALDLPSEARADWVRAQTADDPELAGEVMALLEAEAGTMQVDDAPEATDPDPTLFAALERVGPYRIEAELAHGGMGRVFKAVRDNPRRAAAVKLMQRALHDASAIRRFEYESQILADLDHPNIAHVYESGTLEYLGQSVPWYAMELVQGGRPLDAVIRERQPSLAQKLDLFLQACSGVHHAHQRGVIHRDLKPGNILVAEDGRVKLIDFGIAKSLGPDVDREASLTAQGQVLGTLAYMSPEQTSGRGGAIDVRVDVYALGVILYRLCTGEMPYALDQERIREAIAKICEAPPDPVPLERAAIPVDLRLIILASLAKHPDERYDSVAALAAEVRRFLAGEPIEARPPSLVYQLRRFAGRNRVVVGSALAVFVTLVAGAVASTYGLLEARAARDQSEQARLEAERDRARAEVARRTAEQARDFATSILEDADPWQSQQPNLTLREALQRASQRLDGAGEVDPVTEVHARQTLIEVFTHLGDHASAEREARRALALTEEDEELADTRPQLLDALGTALLDADRVDEADAVLTESLALHQARYGPDDERTWRAQLHQTDVLESRGRIDEAREAYSRIVELSKERLGLEADLTVESLGRLARVQHTSGKLDAAEEAVRLIWEIRRGLRGPRHPATLFAQHEVIQVVVDRGRLEEADRELAQLSATMSEVLGEQHAGTGSVVSLRALVLRRLGRPAEALPLARQALAITEKAAGPDHVHTLRARNNLAMVLVDAGEHAEAEATYAALGEAWKGRAADADGSYLVAAINHAQLLQARGATKEALAIVDESISRAERDYPAEFWLVEYAKVHRERLAGTPLAELEDALESERGRALVGLSPPGESNRTAR